MAGEVHALVGQNGAGKSTMIKILTGYVARDGGDDRCSTAGAFEVASPQDAQRSGISTIYQEINLVPFRSVTENICLGRESRRFGLLDWRGDAHRSARRCSPRFEHRHRRAPAADALQHRRRSRWSPSRGRSASRPSSSSWTSRPPRSTSARSTCCSTSSRQLKARRRLGHLRQPQARRTLCGLRPRDDHARRAHGDDPRDGRASTSSISSPPCSGATSRRFAARARPPSAPPRAASATTCSTAENLGAGRKVRDVSLQRARAARSSGFAGLLGAGRTETARVVFGADPMRAGALPLDGAALTLRRAGRRDRARHRLLQPRIARLDGIVPDMSVRENITLALLPQLGRGRRRRRGASSARSSRNSCSGSAIKCSRRRAENPRTLGRQSAEGAAGALAGDRSETADSRRADARHRRRRQGRDPDASSANSPTRASRC